jgi:plasmid stabilization system protein ParE
MRRDTRIQRRKSARAHFRIDATPWQYGGGYAEILAVDDHPDAGPQAARGDLLKILEYLEGDNPSAVLKVVDALDNPMQLLADNPGIGHLRPDLTRRDVRFWSVFRCLVIYRPDTKPLENVPVLHGDVGTGEERCCIQQKQEKHRAVAR